MQRDRSDRHSALAQVLEITKPKMETRGRCRNRTTLARPFCLIPGEIFGTIVALAPRLLNVGGQSDLTEVWRTNIAAPTLVSQPALDVYRGSGGSKDCSKRLGVFYVSTESGLTATLTAILVDSQGLDPTAPWPKFQKDNANTGNASASLTPWTCP